MLTRRWYVITDAVLLVAWLGFGGAAAKEKKQAEAYCLLVGSCFNERGFSLPGVTILVQPKSELGQKAIKKKRELVSSPRGEFAVRLPAGKSTWFVTAKKKGYRPMEKTVEFANDERQDIVINMEPLRETK